ncbi:hypothetical protein HZI73_10350 [Vallitalea pronyensis]|uniref:Uncharacterized protein n=1 Tax=Vallitalea pronyensis TaxID=1348613 RepID=A0A8J8MJ94_9FIRM|nr:hypothetical protein [Vallitalea pronyensis]QUI22674.1 hypothetical protein HZI73_10350 [Vallitalea pronyensis]
MIKYAHMKADYKQLRREPMMLFLMLLPILLISIGKLAIIYLPHIVLDYTGINIIDYYGYIVGMVFLLVAGMLGIVTGFMMLDDKDARIYELMSITPLGREGYLYNRLSLPVVMTWIYGLLTWVVYDGIQISTGLLLLILMLLSIEVMMIGLILLYVADDKVKGLTYGKGLNIVLLFSLADLLENPFLQGIAKVVPTYWITKILIQPEALHMVSALGVHLLWLVVIGRRFYKGDIG